MQYSKFSLAVFLSIFLLISNVQDAGKADLAKFQGEWRMVSGRLDGADLPEESMATGKRVCKDNLVTVTFGDLLIMQARCTLDATKNPKTIDYDVVAGPSTGKKQLGIYKIEHDKDGDTITFCFAPPDQPRPDDFATNQGDQRTLSSWKKAGGSK